MLNRMIRRMRWNRLTALLACLLLASCGASVRQAAKEAAPAAVEGAAEEAQDPETRDHLARVLADRDIQAATSDLTRAIVDGALAGMTDAERTAELQRISDIWIARVGASLGRSFERDIAPRLSESVANAVGESIERALDQRTEQRLEAMARAMSRGALQGFGESMFDPTTGQPSPAMSVMAGQFAREVTRQAALGFDAAVYAAEQGELEGDGEGTALAAMGKAARFIATLPLLLVLGGVLMIVLCLGALIWALLRLQHHRRLSRAHEDAALALARAIKGAENAEWSDELRRHIARATRNTPGGSELEELLREHSELRLRPRPNAPPSERSATW